MTDRAADCFLEIKLRMDDIRRENLGDRLCPVTNQRLVTCLRSTSQCSSVVCTYHDLWREPDAAG